MRCTSTIVILLVAVVVAVVGVTSQVSPATAPHGFGGSARVQSDARTRLDGASQALDETLQALTIQAPLPHSVHQRDRANHADVPVSVAFEGEAVSAEARARIVEGFSGTATPWQVVSETPVEGVLSGTLRVAAGWYSIDVRVRRPDGTAYGTTVSPVGVGEVLITAGQSNAANSGKPPLSPKDPRVSAYGADGWRLANDPQPIATGRGGSPWPALGDMVAAAHDVPVGLISVAWGGTRVDQWLPGFKLYPRLRDALQVVKPNGARVVLWHQGESDASAGTKADVYAERLSIVIDQSRRDAGWPIPWGVALVSYLPKGDPDRMAAVVEGQRMVIAADPLTFEGPATDDMVGPDWRHDGIHFNERGLREHARRWFAVVPIPRITNPVALLPMAVR